MPLSRIPRNDPFVVSPLSHKIPSADAPNELFGNWTLAAAAYNAGNRGITRNLEKQTSHQTSNENVSPTSYSLHLMHSLIEGVSSLQELTPKIINKIKK